MCGIVYAHNRAGLPVNIDIMQQFDNQRSRGVQGFGLFDGQENNMVHHSKEDGILKWLDKYPSNMILFHHRFPTSTVNVKRAAHPFSTKNYFGDNQYILVHNGMIRNATELFGDHLELGIEYQSLLDDDTFNDSEALLWDFALTMEGEQKELKAYGMMAFVCMKLVKGKVDRLYFGRNSNPLNLYRDKQNISLSSEGAGEPIEAQKLYTYQYSRNRLTQKNFKVPAYNPTYDKPYQYSGEHARGGASGSGAGFRGSYTPGSYAARNSDTATSDTRRTRAETNANSYPSIFDCNCTDVGWQDCEYHGDFDTFDDFERSHDGFDYLRGEANARERDDDAAYVSWWNDRIDEDERQRSAGNWLPENLRTKFRGLIEAAAHSKYSGKNTTNGRKRYPGTDYEYDPKTQLMLPVGPSATAEGGETAGSRKHVGKAIPANVVKEVGDNATPLSEALKQHFDRKTAEQIYVMQKKLEPREDEVIQTMLEYLTATQGHIEMAYLKVEADYEIAEAAPDNQTNIRQRYLLEKVMERMQNDEDYINENSISSLWEDVWLQNKQTA
jgi:predicted glutamine amidotransferase